MLCSKEINYCTCALHKVMKELTSHPCPTGFLTIPFFNPQMATSRVVYVTDNGETKVTSISDSDKGDGITFLQLKLHHVTSENN